MEAVNGMSEVDKGGPPAPSPLTGCYLLIVVGEPHSKEHKDIILRRIAKGLLSWDASDCHVDLEKELAIITEQAPEGEDARYGERLIQFASENLVTEILIHPAISTLSQCMKNLLSSFTRHRHIIHAGYTFAANGSWILQDGTFSLTDFSEAFQEMEVQRVLRAYDNTITLDIHCSPEGDWTRLPKEPFTKNCKVRINPDDVLTSGSPSIVNFLNYISPFLLPTDIEALLESSDVVGNIRFSHPTLYVFPGGQGDAALFGINGFNMLVDGGFARKACFWDFVRHLDRLDAVLLTRLNNSNVNGISSVLRRKRCNTVYPQIGHFFCNIQERKAILSPDGDKDKDPLIVNLLEEGQEIVSNLRQLHLQPQSCYRDIEPINLYHKVGHGTLDMYVLSPAKESKEVREFIQKWNTNDQRLFANQRNGRDFTFPTQNLVSICALLVWQPANANDSITRILFPGSTPQQKIFEGLDKLKQLECIKYPSCSAKTLTPSLMKSKQSKVEKLIQEQKENKKDKIVQLTESKVKIENKVAEENIRNIHANGVTTDQVITEKLIKKHDSTESEKSGPPSGDIKKPEDGKEVTTLTNGKQTEEKTVEKAKPKAKIEQKPKVESKVFKHTRSIERKPKPPVEKKASPTTPKKTLDAKVNGDASAKSKTLAKISPSATPAKSAKEANNRKVFESKYKVAPRKEAPKPEKKEIKERKPISRRPKEISPTGKVPESPVKKLNELHKVEARKSKLEKEGTTDSSTVSTPSADVDATAKKDISKLTPEEFEQLKAHELAELKEEQEVVKEIEAVFRKSEQKVVDDSDVRKVKNISVDDKTEGEGEEYLIIEKEEIEHDSLDEKDTKESETQKHLRDSEESEKQRKLSGETVVETKDLKEEKSADIPNLADSATQQNIQIIPPKDAEVKVKEEQEHPKEASKEISVTSPDDKVDVSSGKKVTDRDVDEENKDANILESQPDEKFSTPIESGATTAPTLPEDERIPLDEIKEDNGDQAIEEKHVKEDTKEKEIPVVQLPPKSTETVAKIPTVVGIRLDKQTPIRDLVKTPDEVADLPVHEEVDIENYEHYHVTQSQTPKQEEGKHVSGAKEATKTEKIEKEPLTKPEEKATAVSEEKGKEVELPVKVEEIKHEMEDLTKTSDIPKQEIKEITIQVSEVPLQESEKAHLDEKPDIDDKIIEKLDEQEKINLGKVEVQEVEEQVDKAKSEVEKEVEIEKKEERKASEKEDIEETKDEKVDVGKVEEIKVSEKEDVVKMEEEKTVEKVDIEKVEEVKPSEKEDAEKMEAGKTVDVEKVQVEEIAEQVGDSQPEDESADKAVGKEKIEKADVEEMQVEKLAHTKEMEKMETEVKEIIEIVEVEKADALKGEVEKPIEEEVVKKIGDEKQDVEKVVAEKIPEEKDMKKMEAEKTPEKGDLEKAAVEKIAEKEDIKEVKVEETIEIIEPVKAEKLEREMESEIKAPKELKKELPTETTKEHIDHRKDDVEEQIVAIEKELVAVISEEIKETKKSDETTVILKKDQDMEEPKKGDEKEKITIIVEDLKEELKIDEIKKTEIKHDKLEDVATLEEADAVHKEDTAVKIDEKDTELDKDTKELKDDSKKPLQETTSVKTEIPKDVHEETVKALEIKDEKAIPADQRQDLKDAEGSATTDLKIEDVKVSDTSLIPDIHAKSAEIKEDKTVTAEKEGLKDEVISEPGKPKSPESKESKAITAEKGGLKEAVMSEPHKPENAEIKADTAEKEELKDEVISKPEEHESAEIKENKTVTAEKEELKNKVISEPGKPESPESKEDKAITVEKEVLKEAVMSEPHKPESAEIKENKAETAEKEELKDEVISKPDKPESAEIKEDKTVTAEKEGLKDEVISKPGKPESPESKEDKAITVEKEELKEAVMSEPHKPKSAEIKEDKVDTDEKEELKDGVIYKPDKPESAEIKEDKTVTAEKEGLKDKVISEPGKPESPEMKEDKAVAAEKEGLQDEVTSELYKPESKDQHVEEIGKIEQKEDVTKELKEEDEKEPHKRKMDAEEIVEKEGAVKDLKDSETEETKDKHERSDEKEKDITEVTKDTEKTLLEKVTVVDIINDAVEDIKDEVQQLKTIGKREETKELIQDKPVVGELKKAEETKDIKTDEIKATPHEKADSKDLEFDKLKHDIPLTVAEKVHVTVDTAESDTLFRESDKIGTTTIGKIKEEEPLKKEEASKFGDAQPKDAEKHEKGAEDVKSVEKVDKDETEEKTKDVKLAEEKIETHKLDIEVDEEKAHKEKSVVEHKEEDTGKLDKPLEAEEKSSQQDEIIKDGKTDNKTETILKVEEKKDTVSEKEQPSQATEKLIKESEVPKTNGETLVENLVEVSELKSDKIKDLVQDEKKDEAKEEKISKEEAESSEDIKSTPLTTPIKIEEEKEHAVVIEKFETEKEADTAVKTDHKESPEDVKSKDEEVSKVIVEEIEEIKIKVEDVKDLKAEVDEKEIMLKDRPKVEETVLKTATELTETVSKIHPAEQKEQESHDIKTPELIKDDSEDLKSDVSKLAEDQKSATIGDIEKQAEPEQVSILSEKPDKAPSTEPSKIEEKTGKQGEKDYIKETDDKTVIESFREDSREISKIDKKLQELKEAADSEVKQELDDTKIEHPSKLESQIKNEIDVVDKLELGRKSPKEREQDVAKIVASVAEVLKSDAPLEEFEGKIPLEISSFSPYTPYSTELRETHITTVESPIREDIIADKIQMRLIEEEKSSPKDSVSAFLDEERKIAPVHANYDNLQKDESRVSSLIKDSTELIQATSKIISDIKQSSKVDDEEDIKEKSPPCETEVPLIKTSDTAAELAVESKAPVLEKPSSVVEDSKILSPVPVELKKDPIDVKEKAFDAKEGDSSFAARKSTPDIKDAIDIDKHTLSSGKSSPEVKEPLKDTSDLDKSIVTSVKLNSEIEKSLKDATTADKPVVSSGKSSPEIKESLEDTTIVDKSVVLSGKASPEIKEPLKDVVSIDKSLVSSEKTSPELKEGDIKIDPSITDTKSTPDIKEQLKDTVDIDKHKHSSGKSTPDIKEPLKDSVDIDKSLVLSGKSTPEIKQPLKDKVVVSSGKTSPEIKEPGLDKSSVISEKSSPEVKEVIKDIVDKEKSPITSAKTTPDIKADVKDVQVTETSISGKTTADIKESVKEQVDILSAPVISGKATPEVPDSTASGKFSPEIKEPITSSAQTEIVPEIKQLIDVEKPLVTSGKVTPEIKEPVAELKDFEKVTSEIVEPVKGSLDATPVASGKTTPEIKEPPTDVDKGVSSGKASPDIVDKSSVASGKTTPEGAAKDALIAEKSSIPSGKSTPETVDAVKDTLSTGKSPVLSGKSTPDIVINEDISPADSGRSTPEIDVHTDKHLDEFETGTTDKQGTAVTSVKSDTPSSVVKQPEIQTELPKTAVVSGKHSPELVSADLVKSEISSLDAKQTSEKVKTESEKVTDVNKFSTVSGNSTPEVSSTDTKQSEKQMSSDKPLTEPEKATTLGKATPESGTSPLTSGKTTPDPHHPSENDVRVLETPVDSRKSSIKESVKVIEDLISDVSEKTTPELKEAVAVTSGKSTPDTKTTAEKVVVDKDIPDPVLDSKSAEIRDHSASSESTAKLESVAGPSSSTKDGSFGRLSPSKSPTEEQDYSRKSTPDIADITKTKELEEPSLGRTTPPTVPVSPVVKEKYSSLHDQEKSDKKDVPEVFGLKTTDVRSSTPASDDCDISSGQVSRVLTTEEEDDKQVYSDDDDLPGSPLSATSQVAHSTSSQYDFEDSVRGLAPIDPMSTSFYGALPDDPVDLSKGAKTSHFLDEADLDFDKALHQHRQTRGEDLTSAASPSHVYEITTAKYSSMKLQETSASSTPVTLKKESVMTASFIGSELPKDPKDDPIASWGKPLGLPSPAPLNDNKGTPKKERKIPPNVMAKNKLNEDKKLSDSKYDRKGKKINPVYVDLTYVPHHGNSNYSYVDFFKRVRARYYVFSGVEPSKEVYNALLEAKQTWDDKELEVTIIPTYDTDVLGYWVAENEDLLAKYKIDLSPSASRCTINLQDHETSCSAYRLEFS